MTRRTGDREDATMEAGRELDALVAERVMGFVVERDWPCTYMPDSGAVEAWMPPSRFADEDDEHWKQRAAEAVERREACETQQPVRVEERWRSPVSRYSTDIAAAWLVVERMHDQLRAHSEGEPPWHPPWPDANYLTLIARGGFGVKNNGGWAASFCCVLDAEQFTEYPVRDNGALADTAPLAICKAALAAMDGVR